MDVEQLFENWLEEAGMDWIDKRSDQYHKLKMTYMTGIADVFNVMRVQDGRTFAQDFVRIRTEAEAMRRGCEDFWRQTRARENAGLN